jgi:hypothetical protein
MGEAERGRDAEFFKSLLAETLTFRRASKAVVNKATYIQDLLDPGNTYEMLESEVTSVQVLEGLAVVTLHVRAKGMRQGQPFAGMFINVRTFLLEPDHKDQPWQVHAWFNMRVSDL